MSVQHLNRLAWLAAVAGLGCAAVSCSTTEKKAPASPASRSVAQTFRFAPPDGTEYVRIDRHRQEIAIVGAPLRRVEQQELRWKVGIDRKGDEYRVKQELVDVMFARDGRVLAKGKPPEEVSAELLIDRNGNLMEAKGLEKAARGLRSLAAPGMEAEAEQVLTPAFLADVVEGRYRVLYGETIGRDATVGSSWTIANPPGSFVESRTVTVARYEPCGAATCARLQVDFRLDPQAVTAAAVDLVKARVQELGGDPSKVTVRNATYAMSGAMLVEPNTMLNHGAALTEGGTVKVMDASGQEITVEVKGTTEFSYSYGAQRVSARPGSGTRASRTEMTAPRAVVLDH